MVGKIWVLSMCCIEDGGGSVKSAELFRTKECAEARVKHYEGADDHWGCVDWEIHEADNPHMQGKLDPSKTWPLANLAQEYRVANLEREFREAVRAEQDLSAESAPHPR